MPLYEHVFIARPDLSTQQAEALIKTYGEIVRSGGGRVGKTEYWGLRNLAYRIKRYRKGHYSLMNLEAPHEAIAEMERKMRLSSDIVRYLTVSVDEHEESPSVVMLAQSERGSRHDDDENSVNDIDGDDMPDDVPSETQSDLPIDVLDDIPGEALGDVRDDETRDEDAKAPDMSEDSSKEESQ